MSSDGLIGIDWGSSHLRAYRYDATGQVQETRAQPWGVRNLPTGGFAAALDQLLQGWPALPLLACGMVGSRHGWVEVPYRELPADAADLAATLGGIEVPEHGHLAIVPGLHASSGPDVMRGEETQVIGALARHPALRAAARIVLPGTHSKWVTVRAGRIQAFRTVMTGELYALLQRHSVLAAGIPDCGNEANTLDADAFTRGVECARESGDAGVLSRLFSARALWLDGQLEAAAIADYLSGMLIGEELRIAATVDPSGVTPPLCLIGEPALCERYVLAMKQMNWPPPHVIEHAAAHGLREIAVQAGWLASAPHHQQEARA